MLFTFPSRYSSTIGRQECLALERGRPSFPQSLIVLRGTQEQTERQVNFGYETFTLFGGLFRSLLLPTCFMTLFAFKPVVLQHHAKHTASQLLVISQ